MMSDPKISIIVPVYNVSKYIEKSLTSLILQSIQDIEIIIVDDCGQDDSMKKVENIAKKDERIIIVHNKQNLGLAESRNVGIKAAKGEYIGFLDSDDFVDENFFEELYKAAIKEQADIACGNVYYYAEKDGSKTKEWVSKFNFITGKKVITSEEDKQYNIYACAVWNKIYKRELFVKYNLYFPKGLYIEDVPITFITTILANKIVLVDSVYLYYLQRSDSIMALATKDNKSLDIFKIYEVCDNYLDDIKRWLPGKYDVYKNILDNFKIFNLYGWYCSLQNPRIKEIFFLKMKLVFAKININDNYFISSENKKIYENVLLGKTLIEHTSKYKETSIIIFGFLRVFKIKKYHDGRFKFYILGIPVVGIKLK